MTRNISNTQLFLCNQAKIHLSAYFFPGYNANYSCRTWCVVFSGFVCTISSRSLFYLRMRIHHIKPLCFATAHNLSIFCYLSAENRIQFPPEGMCCRWHSVVDDAWYYNSVFLYFSFRKMIVISYDLHYINTNRFR